MFDKRFLLIPFASRMVLYTESDGIFSGPRVPGVERVLGYTDFYVFGIRIACIPNRGLCAAWPLGAGEFLSFPQQQRLRCRHSQDC